MSGNKRYCSPQRHKRDRSYIPRTRGIDSESQSLPTTSKRKGTFSAALKGDAVAA